MPVINRLMPVDCGVLSALYMASYQRLRTWKYFIIGHVVLAAGLAFVIEPLAKWSGVYIPVMWKSTYSFPVYIILPIIMRLLIGKLKSIQSSAVTSLARTRSVSEP